MFGTYSSLIHAHSYGVSCSRLWKHGMRSLLNMPWEIGLRHVGILSIFGAWNLNILFFLLEISKP